VTAAYDVSRATARAADGPNTVAVVLALPGDTAEAVLQRILAADTPTAHVVVAEETSCLRRVRDTNFLRRAAQQAGLRIVIVTADPLVVTASRWSGLEVVQCREEPPDNPAVFVLPAAAPSAAPAVPAAPVLAPSAAVERRPALSRRPTLSRRTPRRTVPWQPVVPTLMLLVAVMLFLAYRAAVVSVTIAPPRTPDLMVTAQLDRTAAAAVALRPLQRTFEVKISGPVARVPVGGNAAGGTAVIGNRSDTAIEITADSRFLATDADGRTLAFHSADRVMIPAAVRRSDTQGELLIPGEATVRLAAHIAGSNGNIAADSLHSLRLNDGRLLVFNGDTLTIRHSGFSGGEDSEDGLLNERDAGELVAARQSELALQAEARLRTAAAAAGLSLVASSDGLLEQFRVLPLQMEPPAGSRLQPGMPITVTVGVEAVGQAAPFDDIRQREALLPAFAAELEQSVGSNICRSARLDRLVWDGDGLLAIGALVDDEACLDEPAAAIQTQLRDNLRGLDSDAAAALLERYRNEGLIGEYFLPAGDRMPDWSWLIELRAP
jgi:hypothetical protein